jgi:trans-aconitate methyltransferase
MMVEPPQRTDAWVAGDAYETFMGRWSRRVADDFLEWLAPKPRANWLEVGCGTGALTEAICQRAEPASLVACDPSPEFVSFARNSIMDSSVSFLIAGADDLPRRDGGFDVIVSGLVLNFVPQSLDAVRSMRERIGRGGMLAAYVWDYAEGMQFLRIFWDEAVALDPSAAQLDEGRRFPLCRPDALIQLYEQAGIDLVEVRAFEIATAFPDFDAYWSPFLGGTGPAPSYVDSLDWDARRQLRLRLQQRLTPSADGSIRLTARALGVRGLVAV